MRILYGIKRGNKDYEEEIITEYEERIEEAKKWALNNNYDRLRVAEVNLEEKPDFIKAINKVIV